MTAIILALWLAASAVLAGGIPFVIKGSKLDRGLMSGIKSICRTVDSTVVVDSLSSLLESSAYLQNAVSVSHDSVIILTGPEFALGDISKTVVTATGEVETSSSSGYRGIIAHRANIEAMKADILKSLQDSGYYFASLQVQKVSIANQVLDLDFKIITGPVVTVERVRFKGLNKTRPEFLQKISGLRAGSPIASDDISRAIDRIILQEYLRIDSMPRITPNINYDGVEVLFFVTENRRNRISVAGGYLPRQGNISGQFVGRIEYQSRNLFGYGRRVGFLYDKRDRKKSITDVSFTQPLFIPDYLLLTFRVNQTDYDSLFHSFTASALLDLYSGGQTKLSGRFAWTKTEPEFGSQSPTRTISGGFGFGQAKFAYPMNPSAGQSFQGDVAYVRRVSWPDSVSYAVVNNESMFEIDFNRYQPVFKGLLTRFHVNTRVLITAREIIAYSEQFKIGGYESLRGYRQDQFSGRRVALVQNELRFRPSNFAALYAFTDIGYVYSRRESADFVVQTDEFSKLGAGAGFLFGNDRARLTLEIGWGEGDKVGDGKVHFGLTTDF